MDRLSRQKINKETSALNDVLYQMDLGDIYRTFSPKATEYTFNFNNLFWRYFSLLFSQRKSFYWFLMYPSRISLCESRKCAIFKYLVPLLLYNNSVWKTLSSLFHLTIYFRAMSILIHGFLIFFQLSCPIIYLTSHLLIDTNVASKLLPLQAMLHTLFCTCVHL